MEKYLLQRKHGETKVKTEMVIRRGFEYKILPLNVEV